MIYKITEKGQIAKKNEPYNKTHGVRNRKESRFVHYVVVFDMSILPRVIHLGCEVGNYHSNIFF